MRKSKKRPSSKRGETHPPHLYCEYITMLRRKVDFWVNAEIKRNKGRMTKTYVLFGASRTMNHPIHWRTSDEKKKEWQNKKEKKLCKNMINTFYESGSPSNNARSKEIFSCRNLFVAQKHFLFSFSYTLFSPLQWQVLFCCYFFGFKWALITIFINELVCIFFYGKWKKSSHWNVCTWICT